LTKNSHKKKSGFVKVLRQEERVMKAEYAPYKRCEPPLS
jgi:hypothetical protein